MRVYYSTKKVREKLLFDDPKELFDSSRSYASSLVIGKALEKRKFTRIAQEHFYNQIFLSQQKKTAKAVFLIMYPLSS